MGYGHSLRSGRSSGPPTALCLALFQRFAKGAGPVGLVDWLARLGLCAALAFFIQVAETSTVAAAAGEPYRVVLDAGHGGRDPGTISPFLPLQEKDVTLRLALLTGAALERRGVAVRQTRTRDGDVSLDERAALASRWGAGALISFHLNAAPSPEAAGAEAWYGASTGSADLAEAVLAAVARPSQRSASGVRGTRAGPQLAVLRTSVPAALIEVGYVTNPREAVVLANESYLQSIAEAAATGVMQFLQSGGQRAASAAQVRPSAFAGLYFIRPGDTLGAIARQLSLPVDDLSRLNPAALQSLLPGQALQLPGVPAGLEVQTASMAGVAPRATINRAPVQGTTGNRTSGTSITAGAGGTYRLQPGDTLYSIAARAGVPVSELAQLNGIDDPAFVLAGQTIRLSAKASANLGSAATSSGRSYAVQAGDTLSEVALRHGVTLEALTRANGLSDPDLVLAGTRLTLPAQ